MNRKPECGGSFFFSKFHAHTPPPLADALRWLLSWSCQAIGSEVDSIYCEMDSNNGPRHLQWSFLQCRIGDIHISVASESWRRKHMTWPLDVLVCFPPVHILHSSLPCRIWILFRRLLVSCKNINLALRMESSTCRFYTSQISVACRNRISLNMVSISQWLTRRNRSWRLSDGRNFGNRYRWRHK